MEMEIPDYKVKKYISDPFIDCHGDFSDRIVIEFDDIPSKQFMDTVNQRVVADTIRVEKRWLKFDEHRYCFQASYGDGGRTPKCRKGQQDWIITLDFSDNSKEGIINYGYW